MANETKGNYLYTQNMLVSDNKLALYTETHNFESGNKEAKITLYDWKATPQRLIWSGTIEELAERLQTNPAIINYDEVLEEVKTPVV